MVFYSLFYIVQILVSECAFRISVYGNPNFTIWIILFSIFLGIVAGVIVSIFETKARKVLSFVVSGIIALYFAVNLVYQHIFISILSVAQIGMGGAAITKFFRETLIGIKESAVFIIALLIPISVLGLITAMNKLKTRDKTKNIAYGFAFSILLFVGIVGSIEAQDDVIYGAKDLFFNDFLLTQSEGLFGAIPTTILEIKNIISGENLQLATVANLDGSTDNSNDSEENAYGYNALDIDFDALIKSTNDSKLKELDEYFKTQTPSLKNEYTGKYKDYNVITILCESFSPYLIDEKLTPTLYKLASEGIQFTDYYSCNNNNTSNSEYAFLTSLIPDETLFAPTGSGFNHFREYNSCTASQKNYEPFTLANELKKKGVRTVFYHNYLASYYNRNLTHGNFGFEMVTMNDGLEYSPYWPTSDLELMQQAMPDLLKRNSAGRIGQFYAYFLTFSGHMAYNFETNQIAIKNKDVVKDLNYSYPTKAYVACNYELEAALNYMIDSLDDAGVLDNTLIVIAPDHYPYGLGINTLSELAGKNLAPNNDMREVNTHKGCLIMWTPSMRDEDQIVVNDTISELDILPTLLNLMGIDYDSRLLMGVDAFSNSKHIAVFEDRSFATKDFYYNINTGKLFHRTGAQMSDEELESYLYYVKNKFVLSNNILYLDYYRHVMGK